MLGYTATGWIRLTTPRLCQIRRRSAPSSCPRLTRLCAFCCQCYCRLCCCHYQPIPLSWHLCCPSYFSDSYVYFSPSIPFSNCPVHSNCHSSPPYPPPLHPYSTYPPPYNSNQYQQYRPHLPALLTPPAPPTTSYPKTPSIVLGWASRDIVAGRSRNLWGWRWTSRWRRSRRIGRVRPEPAWRPLQPGEIWINLRRRCVGRPVNFCRRSSKINKEGKPPPKPNIR